LLQLPLQPVFRLRAAQPGNQSLQGKEQHPMAGFDGLDAQGHRQHRLARTRGTEQEQIVAALHEAQSRQFAHQLAIDRGLEPQIELLERLDVRKARQTQAPFHPFEPSPLALGTQHLG
jgi:hypothetical protein